MQLHACKEISTCAPGHDAIRKLIIQWYSARAFLDDNQPMGLRVRRAVEDERIGGREHDDVRRHREREEQHHEAGAPAAAAETTDGPAKLGPCRRTAARRG